MSAAEQPGRPGPRYALVVGFAAVLGVGYVLVAPHTADLAGQTARADLFRRSGFVAYWAGWYGGFPTAGYSLTTPPLLGWLGAEWLGAVSILATGAVAGPLLRDARRPTLGALTVVVMATLNVFSGRTTFAVGVAVGLAAALAVERRHPFVAALLAMLATVSSPVVGVLLLVVGGGSFLAASGRRWAALNTLAGAGIGLLAIAVLSRGSSSGYEPLTRTSVLLALLTTFVVIFSPVGRRLRVTGWLAVGLLLLCFWVHSAVGANATRIAILGALPVVIAAARWPKPLLLVAAVASAALPAAQLHNDLANSGGVESTSAFVAGLRGELARDPTIVDHRVEVVDTASHWPLTYLLPDVSLARGWQRQLDEAQDPLFYGRAPLDPATYRAFLDRYAVGLVALPRGTKLDYGSTAEAALITRGLPYLHEVWSDAHWYLYAVADPTPLAAAPCRVTAQDDTGLTVAAAGATTCAVRLNWSPYLTATRGTVSRAPDGSVRLRLSSGGPCRIHAVWRWP